MTYFQNFSFDFKNLYTQVSADASHVYQQSQSKVSELMNFIGKKYEEVKPKLAEYCKLPNKWHKIPKKCYKIPKKWVEKKLEKYWKAAEKYNHLYDAFSYVDITNRLQKLEKKLNEFKVESDVRIERNIRHLYIAKENLNNYANNFGFSQELKDKVDEPYLLEFSKSIDGFAREHSSTITYYEKKMGDLKNAKRSFGWQYDLDKAKGIIKENSPDEKNQWKRMPWDYKVFYVYPYKMSKACTLENMEKWFEDLCENVWDNRYKLLAGAAVVGVGAYVWKNPKVLEQKSLDSLYKELSKMLKAGSDLLAGYSKQLGK